MQTRLVLLYKIIFLITSFLLFSTTLSAQNQWTDNGIKIADATANNINMKAVSDGRGGLFITWENDPAGDTDIYAQWIDGSGTKRWGTNGVTVTAAGGDQKYPAIAIDGAGGVFVAWQDNVTNDIYAQHLNSSGTPSWGAGGVEICDATNTQSSVEIVSSTSNTAILVWSDKRGGSDTDLYAQKISSADPAIWTDNGMAVVTAASNQSSAKIISDDSGGAYITWQDSRNSGTTGIDIYAQHLNASGSTTWTANGVVISTATENQTGPNLIQSGSQIVIAWDDNRGSADDIYAQALNTSGTVQWTANGVGVCTASGLQYSNRIIADGSGGTIIAWTDNRTEYDIYAQKLNASGSPQWTANGVVVNQSSGFQYTPEITGDETGGALIAWNHNLTGTNIEIHAQHLNSSGSQLWAADGHPVVDATGTQQNHVVVTDGSGGMLTTWQDARDGDSDIYGQHLNNNLSWTSPTSGVMWIGTQSQTIQWSLYTTPSVIDHFSIKASSTPGDGYPHTINTNVNPAQTSMSWTPSTINSTTARIRIQGVNDQGTVICEYESDFFSIDSDPPNTFNLTSPADGANVNLTPTFQWQSTTDGLSGLDHYELWVDGSLKKDNLSVTTYTLSEAEKLTEATHTWTVKAVDAAGLTRQASQTWSLSAALDHNPPTSFHLLSPSNNSWTADTTPALSWQASSDSETGLAKYQLYVDGQLKTDNINPASTSVSSPALSVGAHSWYIVAVDNADNTRQSDETWTINIDNIAPNTFQLTGPGNNSWLSDTTPAFSWQASSDNGIGLTKYQLWIDGSLAQDNISGTTYTLSAGQALSQGTHSWYVIALDGLSNSRSSTSTWNVSIDITPPASFSLSSPSNGETVANLTPTFSWQVSSDGGSGLAEYELWIDGVRNRDNLSSTSTTPASSLSEGSHTWYVKAIDNAGNVRSTSSYQVSLDVSPPLSFGLIYPGNNETIHIPQPTFKWRSTTDAISGFNKFQFFLNNVLEQDNLSVNDTTVTLPSNLSNGNYQWKVKAFDNAGNSRTVGNQNFTVSANPPQITSSASASATEDIAFSYTATATDPDGDNVTFAFSNYPNWMTPSGNQINGTPREGDGNTSFTVTVSDGIFQDVLNVAVTVQAVNDAPNITSASQVVATEYALFTYTATATDPEGSPITFTFQNYPAWMTPSGAQISGTPQEGDNNTSFKVTASDGSKSSQLTVSVTVISTNDPPIITSSSTATATEDILFTYTATATDPNNDPLTYTFKRYPTWLTPSGNKISGTPTEGKQDSSFTLVVNDGIIDDSIKVTLSVQPVNDAPIITSPSSATATEDIYFSYTAAATDPENDPISFTFSNYPVWMSPSGNTMTGTPQEGDGNTSFKVTASDGAASSQLTVTVNVNATNDPPQITSSASANATEDIYFSYTATATDPDGDNLSYTFSDYPAWMTPNNYQISGTPREGNTSTSFKITVSDGSLTDELTITVNVTAVNDPPQITSASSVTAVEDVLFTYIATATDPEGGAINFSFSDYPDWMAPAGNTMTGTPLEGDGNTSFKVTASDGTASSQLTVTVNVNATNDPPQITSSASASATEDIYFSYTAIATDPDGDNLSYTFSDYPSWMTPSNQQINGTPREGDTHTSFKITVSDGSLTDELTVTVNVIAVNDPPQITSVDTVTATEHEPFSYTASGSDPEGTELTFTFENYPDWLTPNGNQIAGTPGEEASTTVFTVIASDGDLTTALQVVIQITSVNDPPQVTSSTTATATENQLFIYTASASDPDSPNLSIMYRDYPSWLTPSGIEIRGTPQNGDVDTTFKVIVYDGSLLDTLTVEVTVLSVNDPPYFVYSLPSPSFIDVDSLNWTIKLDDFVEDPDDHDSTLTWTAKLLDNFPIAIQINFDTRIATIKSSIDMGIFRIAFTATDPHGASITDTVTVTLRVTGIDEFMDHNIPQAFILRDNYPNPFNPTTTICYALPKLSLVTLEIYNLLGRRMETILDQVDQNPGNYEIIWDAASYPSGIYFCRLQAGDWQAIQRMILLK